MTNFLIDFLENNLPPVDCVLGPSVSLEEGIGEAAVKVSQEPFRFQNQTSLHEMESIKNEDRDII